MLYYLYNNNLTEVYYEKKPYANNLTEVYYEKKPYAPNSINHCHYVYAICFFSM